MGVFSFRALENPRMRAFLRPLLGIVPTPRQSREMVMMSGECPRSRIGELVKQMPLASIGLDVYTTPSGIALLGVSIQVVVEMTPVSLLLGIEAVGGVVNSRAVHAALVSSLPHGPGDWQLRGVSSILHQRM